MRFFLIYSHKRSNYFDFSFVHFHLVHSDLMRKREINGGISKLPTNRKKKPGHCSFLINSILCMNVKALSHRFLISPFYVIFVFQNNIWAISFSELTVYLYLMHQFISITKVKLHIIRSVENDRKSLSWNYLIFNFSEIHFYFIA